MKEIKGRYVPDDYLGQQTAKLLAIDYDENQFLATEFSKRMDYKVKEVKRNVK